MIKLPKLGSQTHNQLIWKEITNTNTTPFLSDKYNPTIQNYPMAIKSPLEVKNIWYWQLLFATFHPKHKNIRYSLHPKSRVAILFFERKGGRSKLLPLTSTTKIHPKPYLGETRTWDLSQVLVGVSSTRLTHLLKSRVAIWLLHTFNGTLISL